MFMIIGLVILVTNYTQVNELQYNIYEVNLFQNPRLISAITILVANGCPFQISTISPISIFQLSFTHNLSTSMQWTRLS